MRMTRTTSSQGFSIVGVIVGIVALAVVGVSGWYVRRNATSEPKNQNPPSNETVEKDTSNPTPSATKEESPIVPADYTVYKNADFGFSFAYPAAVGNLSTRDIEGNKAILLYASSDNRDDALAKHTHSPLYVRADKLDDLVMSAKKYGPTLQYKDDKWVVVTQGGGDYTTGSTYPAKIARTIAGTPVYDFSFDNEGCYWTQWAFKTNQSFVKITLPSVCADAIEAIPQERFDNYQSVSNRILQTLQLF